LVAIVLVGLAVGGLMLTRTSPLNTRQATLALAFFVTVTAVGLFPLSTGARIKFTLDTAIFVASILIFPPGVAVLVTSAGVVLAQSLRRESVEQILFNSAQSILQVAAGTSLLGAAGWRIDDLRFNRVEIALALSVGVGLLLVNSLLVAPMVALQTSDSLPQVWARLVLGAGPLQIMADLAQVGLGVVMAYLATTRGPLLVLLLIPVGAGYITLAHLLQLRQQAEARLLHQASHDPLTDLPNRMLLLDRLKQAMQQTEQSGRVVLLFIDLDHFKYINDSFGHKAGDELLRAVARLLLASVRPGATVARLGGDEFVVLLESMPDKRTAERAAADLSARIRAPFNLFGQEVSITASVGIALAERAEADTTKVLHEADVALYRAKRSGRACWVTFDPAIDGAGWERAELEVRLRQAMQDQELWLAYQPLVELATGRIVELEALVRWHHTERGLLFPRAFVPLAEQTGLVLHFGRWVLAAACRQGRVWQDRYQESPIVSVNLSARQFLQPELVEDVVAVLASTGLVPERLKLEITESAMMANVNEAAEILRKLQALGVRIAIDDFGSGYSSLSHLRHLPIDQLKIDRDFIAGLERQGEARAIVRAVIDLADALQIEVVAEGIETLEQAAHLRSLGCELGQGFHFGRPLPAQATTSLLDSRCANAALDTLSST
jgi:diguanylate cyclase (GGDEF)-like protein